MCGNREKEKLLCSQIIYYLIFNMFSDSEERGCPLVIIKSHPIMNNCHIYELYCQIYEVGMNNKKFLKIDNC